MSYCRFGSGDVYMFACGDGGITCCACHIVPAKFHVSFSTGQNEFFKMMKRSYWKKGLRNAPKPYQAKIQPRQIGHLVCHDPMFDTPQAAIDHLMLHRHFGDSVPDYAIERLEDEIKSGEMPYRRTFAKKHRLVLDQELLRKKANKKTRRAMHLASIKK